ncbi:transcription termination factor MTEF18, mitochondrial-like [Magnolia sinica]|uniref:transcription termination factor MTEF18, mitochondrial-like n=1 Tax=Magnolia sinica TaxID=86752 RepID=UPI002658CBA6|nr:transcription termination factor MTEF18, mitochondrial-like [Magnolia sinica]XP_058073458.1 transcription termination factor MTEF18, mitochondrial-like [Magnolia sinica]
MLNCRLCRGISYFCKMLSQLSRPWISPVIPEKSSNLRKNPCFSFQENQFLYSTRPAHVAKTLLGETNLSLDSQTTTRISRIARNEAQDALFDYLHCTRSLHFTDAEHMSKNSPAFLQNLLSKVESEQGTGRSVSRFLRYHPINEFEPFFESLGLKPSEISPLLPRDLMFLSDDDLMLENFHVLCNYGIPRSKIGKMYKEERELFRYDHGALGSKLQAYEEMGLSKPVVIKLVTCSPSLLISGVNGDFIQVLEGLKGMGIENDWIWENLSDKNTYHWSRMLGMLGFLNEMGCSKKDFGRLIRKSPSFLLDDSGRKIYVLTAMLLKLGLGMNEILGLLLQYPRILAGNFAKNLWQAVHFLYEIGMETNDIAKIVRSHPHVMGLCSLKKPQRVLSKLNFGWEKLCDIIKEDPHQLNKFALRSKINLAEINGDDGTYLLEKTAFLLNLGFVENSDEMTKALKQFRGRGDQLQERFDCLVNAGLDYHDVSNMIRMAPPVLNQSKDVIETKIDYLLNRLGYPLQSLVAFPTYLCYDIERINLRFSMYSWLKEKGAAKPMLALSTILACSEKRFLRYLVSLHPEGPEVWEKLKKSSSLG